MLLEEAEDEVDIDAALMGLVDHDDAQFVELTADDPVDERAVGDIDEFIAPVGHGGIAMPEPYIKTGANT